MILAEYVDLCLCMNSCSAGVLQLIRRRKLKAIIASPAALSEFAHVVFPIIAVVTNNPLWTIYALFEIMMWEGSRTVIDAIVINVGKLMRALILGLLLIYTWMIIGIFVFWPIHEENLCSNMFQCFLAYLSKSIRDNGVYEVLSEPKYPHNIADALLTSDLFLLRFAFDLMFQIVFIYIMLAMITGIVIDAFSEMQALKVSKEQDLKSVCFVCNLGHFHAGTISPNVGSIVTFVVDILGR